MARKLEEHKKRTRKFKPDQRPCKNWETDTNSQKEIRNRSHAFEKTRDCEAEKEANKSKRTRQFQRRNNPLETEQSTQECFWKLVDNEHNLRRNALEKN